jgi:hypothetical protein
MFWACWFWGETQTSAISRDVQFNIQYELIYLFYSSWQERRIVLTKGISLYQINVNKTSLTAHFSDTIYFALLKDDVVIDKIPMNEVERVCEMKGRQEEKNSIDAAELMIETHQDGYNSGRTYYLQTNSDATCQQLIQKLNKSRKAARERAHAKTALAQTRQRVGKIYRSRTVQNCVAILIIAVCSKLNKFRSSLCIFNFGCKAEFHRLCPGCAIQKEPCV